MSLSHYLFAISLVLAGPSSGIAQNKYHPTNAQSSQPILTTCEENIALLSISHEAAGKEGFIIAIARLGSGEQGRELNRRRLHNLRVYLTEFDWHRAPKTVITAEGERVKGFGRVELYVAGKLVGVMGIKRNRDLLVGSCEPDDIRPVRAESNLYPYLDRRPQKLPTKP